MKKIRFGLLSILAVSVLLVSCGETIDESKVLAEYLESADSPYNTSMMPKIIKADALQTAVLAGKAYVLDIRSADAFAAGHITGAVNVAAGDVLTHLEGVDFSAYDEVVVACVTGQTAAWATSLANLSGYDVSSLKWGMSSWNSACAATLDANKGNPYATELKTESADKAEAGALPVLETTYETAEEILDARIADVAAAGFGDAAVTAATVFGALDNYYIVNYWSAAHYDLGHIQGAIQYTPKADLEYSSFLNTLPTDKPIAIYCYTGQTSAFMAAYLKVLGYDAKSIKFGVSGMANDFCATNSLTHWSDSEKHEYPLVQ